MRRYLILIPFIIAVFLIGCEPIESGNIDPTPTQETLPMLDGLRIVNANPFLEGAVLIDGVQAYPYGYTLFNDLHNVLGGVDQYTNYAPIALDGDGYFFDAVAKNGTWGFITDEVVLPPVCVVIRVDGFASVVEIESYNRNIKIVASVIINGKEYELSEQDLPDAPGEHFERIWSMEVYGNVKAVVAFRAHYATAQPGTELRIDSIYLMVDESGGHC